ncbi:MAG TPA: YcnI family protein [Modestobacter sp.]|nr:YcnI family protein [Modestobacter sp.]
MSLSLLPTARRLPVVLLAAVVALAGLLVAGTGIASAHVTVASADASPGGYGKVTFRVPNESDAASTVGLRIQLPTDTPLASVRAQPVPGWTVSLTTVALDPPVRSDDGDTITSTVSVVEYRADAGGGIAPGQFQEFALSGGPFPDAAALVFNVVQSYSDGSEAAWIEPTVDGQPEPAHPAPVLSLSGAATAGHGTSSDTGTATAADEGGNEDGGDTTATVALVLAVLGLLAGLAGLFLGLTARRRTVSS